jgi:hypothetical protein
MKSYLYFTRLDSFKEKSRLLNTFMAGEFFEFYRGTWGLVLEGFTHPAISNYTVSMAGVAQLVRALHLNVEATGSIPVSCLSNFKEGLDLEAG